MCLDGQVALDLECLDRLYLHGQLSGYPRLQAFQQHYRSGQRRICHPITEDLADHHRDLPGLHATRWAQILGGGLDRGVGRPPQRTLLLSAKCQLGLLLAASVGKLPREAGLRWPASPPTETRKVEEFADGRRIRSDRVAPELRTSLSWKPASCEAEIDSQPDFTVEQRLRAAGDSGSHGDGDGFKPSVSFRLPRNHHVDVELRPEA